MINAESRTIKKSITIMINRSAVIIRYNQPFVDWINAVDSSPENPLTLAEGNRESTVYLIDVEDQDEFEGWLELNYKILFEEELDGWYTDPALWPQDRSLRIFKEWCSFEFHSAVFDTGAAPILDDEI